MNSHLLPDYILQDRYRIRKILSFSSFHGVYLAKDIRVTDRFWLLKEYISPQGEEESAGKIAQFYETLDVIVNFDHPSLPRILDFFKEMGRHYLVSEAIEGVTLKALCEMSLEPLAEKQILQWAVQICDALDYLHDRPKPFVHSALDPAHIMVTMEEGSNQIRLVNLGLNRFFDPSMSCCAFSTNIVDLTDDFIELGRTLYYLFSGTDFDEERDAVTLPAASQETAKIIQRCLSKERQRNYQNAGDLKRDLQKILCPPEPQIVEEDVPAGTEAESFNFMIRGRETWDRIVFSILSQKITHFALEAAAVLALLVMAWLHFNPGCNYTRKSPVITWACKGELMTTDSTTKRLVDRRQINVSTRGLAVHGDLLYIADQKHNCISIMDTAHNEIKTSIAVDRNPSDLLLCGTTLYCLNQDTGSISVISLEKREMTGLIPTECRPVAMACGMTSGRIFVSTSGGGPLLIMDRASNRIIGRVTLPGGGGPLALSPDEKKLFIANTLRDCITILDTESMAIESEINEPGLKNPVLMTLSPDNRELCILDGATHNLLVMALETRAITHTIKAGKCPLALAFDRKGDIWIANYSSHNISVINAFDRLSATLNTERNPCAIVSIP